MILGYLAVEDVAMALACPNNPTHTMEWRTATRAMCEWFNYDRYEFQCDGCRGYAHVLFAPFFQCSSTDYYHDYSLCAKCAISQLTLSVC